MVLPGSFRHIFGHECLTTWQLHDQSCPHCQSTLTHPSPFLVALNEASTLDTLRQSQSSSQRSLEELTTYVISNLSYAFLGNVADSVATVSHAHYLSNLAAPNNTDSFYIVFTFRDWDFYWYTTFWLLYLHIS